MFTKYVSALNSNMTPLLRHKLNHGQWDTINNVLPFTCPSDGYVVVRRNGLTSTQGYYSLSVDDVELIVDYSQNMLNYTTRSVLVRHEQVITFVNTMVPIPQVVYYPYQL